jgi:hypothetical protein
MGKESSSRTREQSVLSVKIRNRETGNARKTCHKPLQKRLYDGLSLKEITMLDATMWKQDGTGRKVVRYGGYDGVIVEVIQMTFYRHRVTNQLKIIYQEVQR